MAFVGCGNVDAERDMHDARHVGNVIADALEAYAAGRLKARRPRSALRNRPLSAPGHRSARERQVGFSDSCPLAACSAEAPAEASPEQDIPGRGLRMRTEDDVTREERRQCTNDPCPFFAGPPAQALRARSRICRPCASDMRAPIPREPASPLKQPRFNNTRRRVQPCSSA